MNETKIFMDKKPKLKNPICLVGLPGIGNIGRIAIGYMVHILKAKKFAELYSPYFFPFVMVHNNTIHTLRNEFYFFKGKEHDVILLIGDCQTYDPKGHYEVAGHILEFLKGFGCKTIITVGGFGTGKVSEKLNVYGATTDTEMIKELKFILKGIRNSLNKQSESKKNIRQIIDDLKKYSKTKYMKIYVANFEEDSDLSEEEKKEEASYYFEYLFKHEEHPR